MPKLNTRQRIFDYVAKKLIEQGRQSVGGKNKSSCVYRGENGTKCGIGHLIPDKRYSKKLEDNTPHDEDVRAALFKSIPSDSGTTRFLDALQGAHDEAGIDAPPSVWMKNWLKAMKKLADDYDLKKGALA